MSLLSTSSEPVSPGTVATIIVGVLGLTALLGWMMWRMARSVERFEKDPRYLRRFLIFMGALYGFGALTGVLKVISGDVPPLSLFGLVIPVLFVWYFFRTAFRVEVPPK